MFCHVTGCTNAGSSRLVRSEFPLCWHSPSARRPSPYLPHPGGHAPDGDGTFRLRLRSLGPTAVSASSISRFFGLGGSSAGSAVGSTVSIVPSIIGSATSLRFKRALDVLDHGLKLLVRQVLERIAVLDLVLARNQQRQNLEVGGRLRPTHSRNSLLPMLPEVAQKRADDLLAQLVTRAAQSSGGVA